MATGKEFYGYIMEQLAGLEEISGRSMMGEYILYYRGRIFGGIYDDQLMLKITPASKLYLSKAAEAAPYPGAKPMLVVENPENRPLLHALIEAMYPELPERKAKKVK